MFKKIKNNNIPRCVLIGLDIYIFFIESIIFPVKKYDRKAHVNKNKRKYKLQIRIKENRFNLNT